MSLPLRPTHLPCAQQNAARRCPPGSTSAPAGCTFGSSHSQLVRVTLGSSYLRGARAPKALCVSDRLLLQRGCQYLPQDFEVCENWRGRHAGCGCSAGHEPAGVCLAGTPPWRHRGVSRRQERVSWRKHRRGRRRRPAARWACKPTSLGGSFASCARTQTQ